MSIMTTALSKIVAEGKTIENVTTHRFTMTTDDIEKLVAQHLQLGERDSVTFRWGSGQWPDLAVMIVSRSGEA